MYDIANAQGVLREVSIWQLALLGHPIHCQNVVVCDLLRPLSIHSFVKRHQHAPDAKVSEPNIRCGQPERARLLPVAISPTTTPSTTSSNNKWYHAQSKRYPSVVISLNHPNGYPWCCPAAGS